jgi:hypothetical protein
MKNTVLSIVRHLLTIACGIAVGKGLFSEATATELVTGVIGFSGLVWGAIDEYKASKAPKV